MPRDDEFTSRLRDPPQNGQNFPLENPQLEQNLLGSIFVVNAVYEQVAEILRPHHFSIAVHGRIYEAVAKLIDRGEQATPVTLKLLFDQDDALQKLGGSQYLARLAESAVTLINGHYYAQQIIELAQRRALAEAGRILIEDASTVT